MVGRTAPGAAAQALPLWAGPPESGDSAGPVREIDPWATAAFKRGSLWWEENAEI